MKRTTFVVPYKLQPRDMKRTAHVEPLHRIRPLLKALGYQTKNVAEAVKAFQKFRGLPVTGWVGQRTWRALSESDSGFRCGRPDEIMIDGRPQWPKRPLGNVEAYWVSWCISGSLPGISNDTFDEAVHWAFLQWKAVCGLLPYRIDDAIAADILITVAALGGPGGVLADSMLPYQAGQVKQRYDTGERWVYSATPAEREIDLGRVIAHELGHGLGLPHTTESGNLMNPTYSRTIRGPVGAWESAEARKRYGVSVIPPTTPPSGGTIPTIFCGPSVPEIRVVYKP